MRSYLFPLLCISLSAVCAACLPEELDSYEDIASYEPEPKQLQRAQTPRTSWGPGRTARAAEEPVTQQSDVARPTPIKTQKTFNQSLSEWYSQSHNYNLVMKDVKGFYPPVRFNGCVAFMSAALRRLGVSLPIASHDPESPSLVTRPFSDFLEQRLGWFRIRGASDLASGDIVFTQDNPSYPGYPAHVYMFHSWSNRSLGIARVVDNQDFMHERNIYDNNAGFNFTPFAYALRAR
jgi:hypothetical protein